MICLLALLALSLTPTSGQHVVFEDVGHVATSLSYLHVALPLNISATKDLISAYREALNFDDVKKKFSFEMGVEFYRQ